MEETTEGYTAQVISLEKPRYVQEESGELIEGTSHPSPVSVLDSPSFHEGFHLEELTPSPDSPKTGAISSGGKKCFKISSVHLMISAVHELLYGLFSGNMCIRVAVPKTRQRSTLKIIAISIL